MIDYTIDIPYFISHYENDQNNNNNNNSNNRGLISKKKIPFFAPIPRPKPGSPTPEFPSPIPEPVKPGHPKRPNGARIDNTPN